MKQTPSRPAPGPEAGVATCFQDFPFQCSARVVSAVLPTAQALPADDALTAARELKWLGFGLGTRFQLRPFQCRMTVLLAPVNPTAQVLLAEVAATPSSRYDTPICGVTTWAQRRPFQCTIREALPHVWEFMTAHAFVLDVAATAVNAPRPSVAGSGELFHAVPFQCTIIGVSRLNAPVVSPTAHASAAEVAATPTSLPSAGPGTFTRRAVVPVRRTRRCLGMPPCASTPAWPTAHAPPRKVATPDKAPRDGSAGLLTVLQAVPFQCATIGRSRSVPGAVEPTAQALPDDRAATLASCPARGRPAVGPVGAATAILAARSTEGAATAGAATPSASPLAVSTATAAAFRVQFMLVP